MSAENRHSPAPWTISRSQIVCLTHVLIGDYTGENNLSDADMRLISAAPELLEALQAIAGAYRSNGNTTRQRRAFELVRAAIQKATAETAGR
jgi:hypothetical protein